jgi:ABC-type uncharacterized transport system involved in gliding motility auxiliary subunit
VIDPRRHLLVHLRVQTVLWLVLAALLVHLAHALPARLDLTRDGRYGLSDAAREAVADLERPLVARVFFTEPLDPPYHAHRDALLDLLDELAAASGGQLRVTAVDPTGDPALLQEAASLGVRPIPYAIRTRDRAEARTVHMGVALVYGDRQLAIEALPSVATMEIELVRAIRGLVAEPDDRPAIGWWLGHGEPDPATAPADSPLRALAGRLGGRGPFRTIAPGDAPIPDDIDLLMVVAPRRPVPAAEQVHLDQFVMRGGRVLAFLSSFQPDFERGQPVPVDHGLYAWLGAYGVQLGRDLLVDRAHNEALAVPVGAAGAQRWVRVNHPLALVTTAIDRAVPAVRGLPRLVLPFASSLRIQQPAPEGLQAEVWASTEPEAGALKGLVTLDPGALRAALSSEQPGPFPVVVALSGEVPSLFAERALPARIDPEAPAFDPAQILPRSAPTRIVVVSSADAVANDLELVDAAVDWLAEDPVLIGLRSRAVGDPALAAPSLGVARWLRLALVGLPLLALAAVGAAIGRRAR